MPQDFVIAALAGLSVLGAAMLLAIWFAALRFELRYPADLRPAGSEEIDALEIVSVAGRGVTLRDLVALGLVVPSTGTKASLRKKKPGPPAEPKEDE